MIKACVDMMVEYDSLDSKLKSQLPCPYSEEIYLESNNQMVKVPNELQNIAINIARPRPNNSNIVNYDPNLNDNKLSRMPSNRKLSSEYAGVGKVNVLGADIPKKYIQYESNLDNHIIERNNFKDHPVGGYVMPSDLEDRKYPFDLNNHQYIKNSYSNSQNKTLNENSRLAYSIGSNKDSEIDYHDNSDDGMSGVSNVLPKSSFKNNSSCPSNFLDDATNEVYGMASDFEHGVDEVYAHVDLDGTLFGDQKITEEFQQPCNYENNASIPTYDYDYDENKNYENYNENYNENHNENYNEDYDENYNEDYDEDYDVNYDNKKLIIRDGSKDNIWLWLVIVLLVVIIITYMSR
jgi:hypothetical protein